MVVAADGAMLGFGVSSFDQYRDNGAGLIGGVLVFKKIRNNGAG